MIVQKASGDKGGDGLDDKAIVVGHQHTCADDHDGDGSREGGSDADNHDDMTFDDLGAEFVDMPVVRSARLNAACVRKDAAEIANGAFARTFQSHLVSFFFRFATGVYMHTHIIQILYVFLHVLRRGMVEPNLHLHIARDRRPRDTASHRKS